MQQPLRFGVLGPLVVWRDGVVITPRSGTHRSLLGALLLAEGRTLSPDRILEQIRANDPPERGRLWVQVAVSRLRSWLAQHVPDATIGHDSGGYRIDTADDGVDLSRFRSLVDAPSTTGRYDRLAGALALWRGPVLVDGPEPLRHGVVAAAAERLRLDVAVALADAALDSTRPERALPYLEERVRDHPLDERLNAAWALLLAGCGRQADALAAIDATRARLAEELGIDPGQHLRDAHLRVLRQEVLPAPEPQTPMTRCVAGSARSHHHPDRARPRPGGPRRGAGRAALGDGAGSGRMRQDDPCPGRGRPDRRGVPRMASRCWRPRPLPRRRAGHGSGIAVRGVRSDGAGDPARRRAPAAGPAAAARAGQL